MNVDDPKLTAYALDELDEAESDGDDDGAAGDTAGVVSEADR